MALLITGISVWMSSHSVYALEPPTSGIMLESVKPPKVKAKTLPDIVVLPTAKPELKVPAGQRVKVTTFNITGNTVFPEDQLTSQLSAWQGKDLDFEELSQAAERISAYYRGRGYLVARAYLPAQVIQEGRIEIAVMEGRIGEVKLNLSKEGRLREQTARDTLNTLRPGDLITESSLEHSLLILNDIPGVIVRSTLEPGAAVGTADLVVDVVDEGKLMGGSLDFDNGGSRTTGEYHLGANLNFNNPSGYGDFLSLRILNSDTANSPLSGLSYAFLLDPASGTRMGVNLSQLKYTLGKDFAVLNAHGSARVTSVYIQHSYVRSRRLTIIGTLVADIKNTQDVQNNVVIDEKNLYLLNAGVSGNFASALLGDSMNSFSLTLVGGIADINNANVIKMDESNLGYHTQGQFQKFNYDYQRMQSLGQNTSLSLGISGQLASKNLASAEKFSLGGPKGVRAYPVGEASADEGVLLKAELNQDISQAFFRESNSIISGFIEGGSARIHHKPLTIDTNNNRTLSAYGLSLTMGDADNYSFRTSIAWRGSNNLPQADKDRNPRAWVQFSKFF
jgi:hemolysin activation/secretion protein